MDETRRHRSIDPSSRFSIRGTPARPHPDDVTFRQAGIGDMAALATLERDAPTQTSDGAIVTIDRGPALQDHFDLQREYTIQVAERSGRLVGARALAVREVEVEGTRHRYALSHFVRVLPEVRGKGIFEVLHAAALEAVSPTEHFFAYMDPGNDAMRGAAQRNFAGATVWSVRPIRALIACENLAGPTVGRRATRDDSATIVQLLNVAHSGEGFFVPYTEQSLHERLARVPSAYSWNDLLLTDNAVVGVWLADQRRSVERNGTIEESRRGLILDYGFCDDAAGRADLEALIHTWCALALEAEQTHLSIFTSDPSRNEELLKRLATQIEPYEFPSSLPEPDGLAESGLYVDQIYF
jgi:GNAT superfamily N-acetyltransferase